MPPSASDSPLISDDLQLGLTRAEDLLRGIIIPPRPSVLTKLLAEQQSESPDLQRIGDIIQQDVALAASTLKVVNSPFYGLQRKVGSIHHAVRMLGVNNIVQLVTGLMLHSAFKTNDSGFMDVFWASSNRLSMIALKVAPWIRGVTPDEACAVGLFCDCGVPLMVRRFETYPDLYSEALLAGDQTITDVEQDELGTQHTLVGYLIARSWKLPALFGQAILRHHDADDYFTDPPEELDDIEGLVPLLATLRLSHYYLRHFAALPQQPDWLATKDAVLAYCGWEEAELHERGEELHRLVREASAAS